jgi:hypothetical protein
MSLVSPYMEPDMQETSGSSEDRSKGGKRHRKEELKGRHTRKSYRRQGRKRKRQSSASG